MNHDRVVYCDRSSTSAARLAQALGWARIRDGEGLARRQREAVINWGSTSLPNLDEVTVYNPAVVVANAISKRESYTRWAGQPWALPLITAPEEGCSYLLRRDGLSGGRGIGLWTSGFLPPNMSEHDFLVPLFRKTHEFRVHVAFGRALGISQKRARRLFPVNRVIRSHDNGWIFSYNNLILIEEDKARIMSAAVDAVFLLGLDFGAADVLAKLTQDTPRRVKSFKICEINTAPGVEQRTLSLYARAFKE